MTVNIHQFYRNPATNIEHYLPSYEKNERPVIGHHPSYVYYAAVAKSVERKVINYAGVAFQLLYFLQFDFNVGRVMVCYFLGRIT